MLSIRNADTLPTHVTEAQSRLKSVGAALSLRDNSSFSIHEVGQSHPGVYWVIHQHNRYVLRTYRWGALAPYDPSTEVAAFSTAISLKLNSLVPPCISSEVLSTHLPSRRPKVGPPTLIRCSLQTFVAGITFENAGLRREDVAPEAVVLDYLIGEQDRVITPHSDQGNWNSSNIIWMDPHGGTCLIDSATAFPTARVKGLPPIQHILLDCLKADTRSGVLGLKSPHQEPNIAQRISNVCFQLQNRGDQYWFSALSHSGISEPAIDLFLERRSNILNAIKSIKLDCHPNDSLKQEYAHPDTGEAFIRERCRPIFVPTNYPDFKTPQFSAQISVTERIRLLGATKALVNPLGVNPSDLQRGGVLDLRTLPINKETIIIGDLHGRLDNFRRIVKHLESRFSDPKVCTVAIFLGDLVHPESIMDALNMDSSIQLMREFFSLKNKYPRQVHLLPGNHDLIDGDASKHFGMYDQSGAFRERLQYYFGEAYLDQLRAFLAHSPLVALMPEGLACHAGPYFSATLSTLEAHNGEVNRHRKKIPEGLRSIVWGADDVGDLLRDRELDKIQHKISSMLTSLGLPHDATVFAGHVKPQGSFSWYENITPNYLVTSASNDKFGVISLTADGRNFIPL